LSVRKSSEGLVGPGVLVISPDPSMKGLIVPAGWRLLGVVASLGAAAAVIPSLKPDVILASHEAASQPGFDEIVRFIALAYPDIEVRISEAATPSTGLGREEDPEAPPGATLSGDERRRRFGPLVPGLIVVWSPKGGVGKTFVACNLAVALVQSGAGPVALVDLDLKMGDVAVHLDVVGRTTLADVLPYADELNHQILEKYVIRHPSGLRILPAPGRPELAELAQPEQIRKIIDAVRKEHAFSVLDMPADVVNEVLYDCLEHASRVVLLTTQDPACLRQVKIVTALLGKIGLGNGEKLMLVVNRFSDRSPVEIQKIEAFLGMKAMAVIPEDRDLVEASVFRGRPVALEQEESQVSRAIRQIAVGVYPAADNARPVRRTATTLLSRLFRGRGPSGRSEGGRR